MTDSLVQLTDILTRDITSGELEACIRKLKYGKAAADERITNELLKNATNLLCKCILWLFNECLAIGVYPWNTAIVTQLHHFTRNKIGMTQRITELSQWAVP